MEDLLKPTPQHLLKPNLMWCGKLLGCDIYIDTHDWKKRDVTEKLLKSTFEPADPPHKEGKE